MRHSLEARGNVLVIKLEGNFCNDAPDYFKGLEAWEDLLQPEAFRQFDRVVFDFSKVGVMTSSGIGILIAIHRMASKASHSDPVAIACTNQRVKHALVTCGIASMFEFFDTMDRALGVSQQ